MEEPRAAVRYARLPRRAEAAALPSAAQRMLQAAVSLCYYDLRCKERGEERERREREGERERERENWSVRTAELLNRKLWCD
jgi:hypothetical protein